MKRVALVSAVLGSLLPSGISAQAASVESFNSKVTIAAAGPRYHGKVRSRLQSECEPGRRVLLYEKVPGFDPRVGRDTTNELGRWKITPPDLKPGRFYAIVRQQRLGNGINCRTDKSDVVKFVGL